MIKPEIAQILGRTIEGVVVKESDRCPRCQVFLVFTDGTYYELYTGSEMSSISGLMPGGREEVLRYMSGLMKVHLEAWL